MSINAITVGTVRENYTLVTESAVLFNSLTHTDSLLIKSNIIEIKKDSDKT